MDKKIFGILFLCLMTFFSMSFAQKKNNKEKEKMYEIKFVIEGIPDTMLYVASYYADKTYMQDSLCLSRNEPHTFIFSGDTVLPRGVYVLAGQDKVKYLDFIIDSSLFFTLRTKNSNPNTFDFFNNIEYENSPENKEANFFFRKMSYFQNNIMRLNNKIKELEKEKKPDTKLIKQTKKELDSYQDSSSTYYNNFIKEHGKSNLFGKTQYLAQDIEVPEPPKDDKGNIIDSNFAYYYYVNHYWDHCDFSEGALIYTPVFQPKLVKYFDQVVPPMVDSITKYADLLLEKTKQSPELFKYVVWYITNKYERSQYVGHDAIFVHMVLNYYAKGLCPWTNEAVLERMIDHAEQLDKILLGRVAPEIYMFDTNNNFISSHSFNKKYTILFFWDVKCGHCKTSTPKLVEFYNRAKDELDFEVYAVCLGSDTTSWKQAIVERGLPWINVGGNRANMDFRKVYGINTTPIIYVLDKEKRIIVKKIGVENLESFLRNHEQGKRIY